jgi:VWFA-related protein
MTNENIQETTSAFTPEIKPEEPPLTRLPNKFAAFFSQKKNLLLVVLGLIFFFLILGGTIFVLGSFLESKFFRDAQFDQGGSSPYQEESITATPTQQSSVTPGSGGAGIPLIGGKQELIGSAKSLRNLAGMLVQINQIDPCSFPEIKIFATLTDRENKPVTNVLKTDFRVFEDGKEITDFQLSYLSQEQLPLTVSLVIDHSGSMEGEPMTKAKEAAINFVNKMAVNDKVEIVQFDTQIDLLLEETTDKNSAIDTINNITTRSDTALYDVTYFAAESLGPCGRKAIVLLTDGRDTVSKLHSLEQAIDKANRANIPVFVVGLKSYQFTPSILQRIAEETGAQYFEAPTPADLDRMYQAINDQLRGQYLFWFSSSQARDTNEHHIQIKTNVGGSETSSEKSYLME